MRAACRWPMPFCAGKLPPGTRFDEIRIGASAGAALAVNSLHIRTRVGLRGCRETVLIV